MNTIPEKPGDRILEELRDRDWTQAILAEVLGRPQQAVSEIVNGKKEITRETAVQLGAALGVPAHVWLEMQDRYALWLLLDDREFQRKLADIRSRAKAVEIKPKPAKPVYKVEWSVQLRKHIATVDTHPGLMATARSAPYAERKLRALVYATKTS